MWLRNTRGPRKQARAAAQTARSGPGAAARDEARRDAGAAATAARPQRRARPQRLLPLDALAAQSSGRRMKL
jgi:hypothetical protein